MKTGQDWIWRLVRIWRCRGGCLALLSQRPARPAWWSLVPWPARPAWGSLVPCPARPPWGSPVPWQLLHCIPLKRWMRPVLKWTAVRMYQLPKLGWGPRKTNLGTTLIFYVVQLCRNAGSQVEATSIATDTTFGTVMKPWTLILLDRLTPLEILKWKKCTEVQGLRGGRGHRWARYFLKV